MKTLIPAYGRDYKSASKVKADWQAGKDFLIADFFDPYDGKPTSKRDWPSQTVMIRYNGLRKTTVLKG